MKILNAPFLVVRVIHSLFCLALVFLIPPFQSPDEPQHFFRAYQIATGQLIASKVGKASGGEIPLSVIKMRDILEDGIPFHSEVKFNTSKWREALQVPLEREPAQFAAFSNTALYSPIAYLPQVLAIRIALIFDAAPVIIFYAGRLAGCIFALVALNLLMSSFRERAILPVIVISTPISMYLIASITADTFTTVCCWFWIMHVLDLLQQEEIKSSSWVRPCAFSFLLALTKVVYVLPVLLVCFSFFERRFLKGALLTMAFFLSGAILWQLMAGSSLSMPNPSLEPENVRLQIESIWHHPGAFLWKLLLHPVLQFLEYPLTYFNLGWLDTIMSWRVILINLLALVISLAFLPGSSRNERLAASLTFFSILFVTLGVIYLTWNPPGAPFIAGFQARYLIPIMPLLLIACGMGIRKPSWFRLDIFYICLIAYNVFATTKIILHRYY